MSNPPSSSDPLEHDPNEGRYLKEDYERKRIFVRAPKAMGDVMSQLLARRGYARMITATSEQEAWELVAGEKMATVTKLGSCRRGVLEIVVASSMVLQELTFLKADLLSRLQQALPDAKIRDLKFKVGKIVHG
ncbi:protein of unknown function DUF721 [Pirellula staleyi DSM 6068]|uniref:DUF721 domain-containing protein n=1 Tax=Pirellula staleyi (strain ATCC 27377 / DSM 6068 / ICPB 4128) TaxID=530564 RepID=D2R8B0_PIRSD|nr:DUF721 domain-containing protein [Pirellula staleyi]ADB15727.1 protein of unknown function DUF721 [Pirellula staleyi DSM 6068]